MIVPSRHWRRRSIAIAVVWLAALPFDRATAVDLLRLNSSAPAGSLQIEARANAPASNVPINPALSGIKENHLNFRVLGLRPIPLFSGELRHIDLGHFSGRFGRFTTDASMRGTGAFGVLHMPLPWVAVDIYAEGGLARLRTTSNFSALPSGALALNCPSCNVQSEPLNHIKTSFAGGAGAQIKLSSWELRANYDRFVAGGSRPKLLTVGFAWKF